MIVGNVLMNEAEIEGYERTDPRADALGLPPGTAGMQALLDRERLRQDSYAQAMLLVNLGWAYHRSPDWESVIRHSSEAARVLGELGSPFVTHAQANAANAMLALDRTDQARQMTLDALTAVEHMYPDPFVLFPVLTAAADLLHRQGDNERAATVAGAAVALVGDLGGFADDRAIVDAVLEQVTEALGQDTVDALLTTGAATPLRDVIRAATRSLDAPPEA